MKKIAITGGKGGTGKSTFSVLLANKLSKEGKRVLLSDCDVECPNDYLLMGEKLRNPVEKTFTEFPKLEKRKCKKCGICAQKCPEHAIFQKPGEYPIFIRDLCAGCGLCWAVCPFGAIRPQKEATGKIFLNQIRKNFWLVTGRAKPGLQETGAMVLQTKKFALNLAKKLKVDIILFDTAAGTHCPVISALLDCDFAFVVTEPTPMGAHDLDLILELCQKLKVPAKIVLNQADLGDKREIKKISKKYKVKIEREIPYSKEIAQAYAQSKLLSFNSKELST